MKKIKWRDTYQGQWYHKNKKRMSAYKKKYYDTPKWVERMKKYKKKWRENNREYSKKYRLDNPDKFLKYYKRKQKISSKFLIKNNLPEGYCLTKDAIKILKFSKQYLYIVKDKLKYKKMNSLIDTKRKKRPIYVWNIESLKKYKEMRGKNDKGI